jgi:hypothetical protein
MMLTRRDSIRRTIGAALGASMLGVNWASGSENAVCFSLVTDIFKINLT